MCVDLFHVSVMCADLFHVSVMCAGLFHVSVMCVDLFLVSVMCVDLYHVSVMCVDLFHVSVMCVDLFHVSVISVLCFSDAGGPVLWDDRPADSRAVHLHHRAGSLQVVVQDTGDVPPCSPYHLWLEGHAYSASQSGLEAGRHLPRHPHSLTGQWFGFFRTSLSHARDLDHLPG